MKKTKNGKIGTIFIVSILALAGVGISYAGLTDIIHVYGTVGAGTVDLEIDDYSGTWVWKVYPHDIMITDDPTVTYTPDQGELVAFAKGRDVTAADPTKEDGSMYDAVVEFDNLFPCIDFTADIVFHYVGTIPCKVTGINWGWSGDKIDTTGDGSPDTDFIDYLMQLYIDSAGVYGMTGGLYRCDENGNLLDPIDEIDVGYQLHECNYFKLIVTIHLPQDNMFQGLEGNGYFDISVLQWNDMCDEEEKPGIIIVEKQTDPDGAGDSFEFSTSYGSNFFLIDDQTDNSGPLDPGIYSVAEIDIPSGWSLVSATCDDGSDPSAIMLDSGETVICTFINEEEKDVDIKVEKTVDDLEPEVGSEITYTITATNIDLGDATGVQITDVLPDGVTYVPLYVASQGTYDPISGIWNVGSLASGAFATLDITVTVDAGATTGTFTQLAMVLDGSGSIGSSDFGVMTEGLAVAVETYVPHNGMVELTVVHFASYHANVEVGPIIITDDPLDLGYYTTVANQIRAIPYRGGYTPLACGLYLAADTLKASANYHVDVRQVINVVTDGVPNVDSSNPIGSYSGVYVGETDGKTAAEAAMTYLLSTLAMTSDGVSFDGDEVDVEAIDFPAAGYTWLKGNIVFPLPANEDWPPTAPGWIRSVATYDDFAETIKEKFIIVFEGIENCAELTASTPADTDPTNNKACVTITPQPATPP